jgi:16S rRNA (guanine527-N7)-methyltransferase
MGLDALDRDGLLAYLALLEKWNKTYNLTAIHEPERMLTHHLLDSLAILPYVEADRLLDVGSGPGLPGIPLALARPAMQVTLIDASQKKCAFMQQAAIDLGLGNVEVRHVRAEDLRPADAIPADRLARLQRSLRVCPADASSGLAPGGEWLAMKGLYPHEEIAQLKGARLKAEHVPLRVPELDADRHLIVMEPVCNGAHLCHYQPEGRRRQDHHRGQPVAASLATSGGSASC